jgi:hypothetical protein
MWLDLYQKELGALSFPWDGAQKAPYPIYDRWGDSFNVQTEFVVVNQARALATAAFLMAQTPVRNQAWKSLPATIDIQSSSKASKAVHTATLKVPGLDLREARIVWEAPDQEPAFGSTFSFTPPRQGACWVEAEAQWPDGRRVFAITNFANPLESRQTP